jgi:hypothetical protein
MDLRDLCAFSPPRPASETADLVDLLQGKVLSQPEALARGRPSLANAPLPEYRARGARTKDVGKDEARAHGYIVSSLRDCDPPN